MSAQRARDITAFFQEIATGFYQFPLKGKGITKSMLVSKSSHVRMKLKDRIQRQSMPGFNIVFQCLFAYTMSQIRGCLSRQTIVIIASSTDACGVFKKEQVYKLFETLPADEKEALETAYTLIMGDDTLKQTFSKGLERIRKEFLSCPSDQYFCVPVILFPVNSYSVPVLHANAILISKAKGTVLRIEPGHSGISPECDAIIKTAIVDICNDIGLKDARVIEPEYVCPQAVTKDSNCVTWTMLIVRNILMNLYKQDVNTVIKQLLAQPNIPQLIESFKEELLKTVIPQGMSLLGREWEFYESFMQGLKTKYGGRRTVRRRQRTYRQLRHN